MISLLRSVNMDDEKDTSDASKKDDTNEQDNMTKDDESMSNDKASTPEVEEKTNNSSSGGWWSGWYESAIKTSTQALESMKKDFGELKQVVQAESRTVMSSLVVSSSLSAVASTASYIKDTANYLLEEEDENIEVEDKDQAKNESKEQEANQDDINELEKKKLIQREVSFEEDVQEILKIPETFALKATEKITSIFNTIVDVLTPIGYDDDDIVLLPNNQSITRERWDLLIRAIQADPQTFYHDPEGSIEEFALWVEKFDMTQHETVISNILQSSSDVRKFYEKLIPTELTKERFWQRYFYRVDQLKEMESKGAAALKARQELVNEQNKKQQKSNENEKSTTEVVSMAKSAEVTNSNISKVTPSSTGPAGVTQMTDGSIHATPVNESSRGSSEEWEKTSMTEIVDEAAKKLADKLQTLPTDGLLRGSVDEDLGEWELE